jgi:hypothetical protein
VDPYERDEAQDTQVLAHTPPPANHTCLASGCVACVCLRLRCRGCVLHAVKPGNRQNGKGEVSPCSLLQYPFLHAELHSLSIQMFSLHSRGRKGRLVWKRPSARRACACPSPAPTKDRSCPARDLGRVRSGLGWGPTRCTAVCTLQCCTSGMLRCPRPTANPGTPFRELLPCSATLARCLFDPLPGPPLV